MDSFNNSIAEFNNNLVADIEKNFEKLNEILNKSYSELFEKTNVFEHENELLKNQVTDHQREIRYLNKKCLNYESEIQNYNKVSIVKNLNKQLSEKNIELEILSKKYKLLENKLANIDLESREGDSVEENSVEEEDTITVEIEEPIKEVKTLI